MPDRTKQTGEHLTVAVSDERRAGSYHVDLATSPDAINTRLKAIGEWLIEWQMPHQVRLVRDHDQARICLSFTHAEHAHAFQLTFGGDERIDAEPSDAARG